MISLIQAWFNRISSREKWMLVAFLWVLIFIWWGNVRGKQHAYSDRARQADVTLKEQRAWFDESPRIDASIRAAMQRLQSQPSYGAGELAGRIDGFVRELNLQADVGAPRSQEGEVFNVHSLKLRVRHATLEDLIKLDDKFRGHSPYLNLESVSLRPDTTDPMYLDAQISVQSLELKHTF